MFKIVLLVGLGGFIGSVTRYMVTLQLSRVLQHSFPFGTFFVNVIGCLIIGLIYGLLERHLWLSRDWALFLATGFCGGFTTFSSFSIENFRLLQSGEYVFFGLYAFGSVIVGLLATVAGFALSKI